MPTALHGLRGTANGSRAYFGDCVFGQYHQQLVGGPGVRPGFGGVKQRFFIPGCGGASILAVSIKEPVHALSVGDIIASAAKAPIIR